MKFRTVLVLACLAFAALVAAPATSAAAYPPTTCATLSVSTTTPVAGATITVTGQNFNPNATIRLELHTTTYLLATVTSNSSGSFSTHVTLPSGVTGTHDLIAVGGTAGMPSGCPSQPVQVLQIQGAGTSGGGTGSGSGGGTAFTGVDVLAMIAGAAVLLAAGLLFARAGRRRRVRV
jgi:hypothetical protein